jgi:hypothetical protein
MPLQLQAQYFFMSSNIEPAIAGASAAMDLDP